MKTTSLTVLGILLVASFGHAAMDNSLVRTCSSDTMGKVQYSPPIISNGDVCTMVDFRNCQFQDLPSYKLIRCVGGKYRPSIYRAGRRTDDKKLACFGRFEERVDFAGSPDARPGKWTHTLDLRNAVSETVDEFRAGISTISSTVFVHANLPVIAIRKKFQGQLPERYVFKYVFAEPNGKDSPLQTRSKASEIKGGFDINYVIEKREGSIAGTTSVLCDAPNASFANDGTEFSVELKNVPREVSFFLIFADDFGGNDAAKQSAELKKLAWKEGFAGMYASHSAQWKEFWDRSHINIPDKKAEDAYYTALYNLKCYSTKWSIPVGIFRSHWQGCYFGFTFFNPALCAANHLSEAEKVVNFWRSLLSYAHERAGKKNPPTVGARWSWLSIENGDNSCASGRWLDHVLHMCNIALETWTCYRYSNDKAYLEKTGYPVLKGCADFFQVQMVYELKDGRTIIGKCCDLERLPPAIENAFLTTCGAIALLEFAADAADVLRVDSERAALWRETAAKLKKCLPSDGQKYLPYPGAQDRSVAALSGVYPYGVIAPSDPLQRAAIYDFEKNAMSAGNMYKTGERICSWYAAWLAAAQARLGDGQSAYRNVRSSLDSVGKFGEIFEINEPKIMSVPWCSSPQGTYIQAVNEMLLQCEGDTVKIAPAIPREWKDYEFSLKAFDDLAVDTRISGGNVEKLTVKAGKNYSGRPKTLVLPNGKSVKVELGANGEFSL
jgi:hypothetical protein